VARVGDWVFVGGTTSVTPDGAVVGGTPGEQAREIFRKIAHELSRAGASLSDVVKVQIYVTDISRSAEVGLAHGEIFGDVRPLMTMFAVEAFVDPRMLVEIEATAFCPA
jgi:enamine deaminase RidA (YjgF/YER057c/UK114 family)